MKVAFKSFVGVAGVLVFAGILVAANALVASIRLRWDVTAERLYTLSDGTKKLLGSLDRDVTLKFYYTKSSPTALIPLKQYAQRILDLLHEYELESKGRLTLEVYDPKPDSDEEEWAQRYGLAGQPTGLMGEGENIYLGLVAVSGAKEALIPIITPGVEPQLEYLVTQLISETIAAKKRRVGIMSALPVFGDQGSPFAFRQGAEPWIVVDELKKSFDVTQVDAAAEAIPDDIDALVVIHPKDFGLKQAFAIDQFVLRGGHLVLFEDPLCLSDADPNGQDLRMMIQARSELNKLTRAWGLEMDALRVVADPGTATRVRFGSGATDRSLSWLTLRRDNLDKDEIATASLDYMLVPFVGAFKGKPSEGLAMTTLLRSSRGAGTIGSFTAMSAQADLSDFAKEVEPLPMAVQLTGKFKSAFPDGKPLEPGDTNAAPTAASSLKESQKNSVVVLVADVDLLSDRVAVERIPFARGMYQRTCDNIDFVVNVVGQLAGDESLISLRSRNTFRRPFTRVANLEIAAAQKWREEEIKLQKKLQDAQTRLNELQANKDPKQQSVLSPEQQAELEKFRKEQFETRSQLRIVKRNLNSDIEALGLKLKVVNMAAVPAFVALFGLAFGLRRRIRASR